MTGVWGRIRKFLESISPINHAHKITAPLSIAHGETDVRVTVQEGIQMSEIVSKQGYVELIVCENEGHGMCILFIGRTRLIWAVGVGFKPKSEIKFTNAAKIRFLEKFLMSPNQ